MSTEQNNEQSILELPAEAQIQMPPMEWYEFDFEKINSIEDIKIVLQAMGMKFNQLAPNFDKLKEYGKKVDL